MSANSKTLARKLAILLVSALLVSGVLLHVIYSSTPDGMYEDMGVGAIGGAYLVIEHGEVTEITVESTNSLGNYTIKSGVWIFSSKDPTSEVFVLKPTLLGIRIIGTTSSDFDRFLPRKGFGWLVNPSSGR